MKEIHTGFYSDKAEHILNRMLLVLKHRPFHMSKKQSNTGFYCKIVRASDGELLLNADNDYYSTYLTKLNNDIDGRNWIAFQLKLAVQKELEQRHSDDKHKNWNRNCKQKLDWFNSYYSNDTADADKFKINVQTVYCMYDLMRGRDKTDQRFDNALIEELRGSPYDPFRTEQENVRRAEIKRLMSEKQNAHNSLFNEMCNKKEDIRKKYDELASNEKRSVNEKYEALMDQSDKEFDDKIAEVNNTFKAMVEMMTAVA